MPPPNTVGDEFEALLYRKLVQEMQANALRVAALKRRTVRDVEQAFLHRASRTPSPRPVQAEKAPTPPIVPDTAPLEQAEADPVAEPADVSIERIVEDLARW